MAAKRIRRRNLDSCGLRAPAQKYGPGDSQAPESARLGAELLVSGETEGRGNGAGRYLGRPVLLEIRPGAQARAKGRGLKRGAGLEAPGGRGLERGRTRGRDLEL